MFREEFGAYINRKEYREIQRAIRLTLKQDPNHDLTEDIKAISAKYRRGKDV
jgi:hypothetical protein